MLELYINNKLADISEESIIAVTKTYERVSNPVNFYSEYSKTVKLPLTERNNDIFCNFNRQDSVVTTATLDYTKKIPFILLDNKEQLMSGYIKLENANTIYTDECYEITMYSTFGMVMNTLKQLTFNTYATDIDPQYIIQSPFEGLRIDRGVVLWSFEREGHNINGNLALDWIGFIPTYQGKYSDFSSDKEQILENGRTEDLPRERDEHYMREFRSYYQQPFIWVDKLWKIAKDKINQIDGYTLNLDLSWFTQNNPYYSDLIYTCPTLFNEDDNFSAEVVNMQPLDNIINYIRTTRSLNPWDFNTTYLIGMQPTVADADLYNNSTFNPNGDRGTTKFHAKFRFTLFAPNTNVNATYARIKENNPFYVRFRAVNTQTNQEIPNAYKEFLVYSNDSRWAMGQVRENCDMEIASRNYPNVSVPVSDRLNLYNSGSQYGQSHTTSDGFFWETEMNVDLNVYSNVPYRIEMQVRNLNNDYPFEYTTVNYTPNMFTNWTGFFEDSSNVDRGYSIYLDELECSCESTSFLRSSSELSLYRIFPKDTTLCDVLLNYSKMFGLVWEIDEENKEITVMTRNRFFTDYTVKDWSEKIDRSRDFKITPLSFDKKYVVFNFENGECGRLEKYQAKYKASYGEKKIDTGYDFNADKDDLFEKLTPSVVCQKKQMSRMMNTDFEDRPNFMGYDYKVLPDEHYVDNDNEGSNAGMSGAFYFRNGTFTPDSQISHWDAQGEYCVLITDDTSHQAQTGEYCWNTSGENYALCHRIPDVGTVSKEYDGKRYSVHFAAPVEYFYDVSGDVNYLYENYWERYINERYCSQNKMLTAYVYLSPKEYASIDFREFIKIDNVLYHIDKIYDYNYNTNQPVKVDLVQVWDITAYTQGQDSFEYFYAVPEVVTLSSTDTVNYDSVDVYISNGDWAVVGGYPNWITAYKNNSDLMVKPNSTTTVYREGNISLVRVGTMDMITVQVVQYPQATCRLDVDRQTIVTDFNSSVQWVEIDTSNRSRNAITITSNKSWVRATILEYLSTGIPTIFLTKLHLMIVIDDNYSMNPRNATVTLSMTCGGSIMDTVIHIGQQCAYAGEHIIRPLDVITELDSPFEVFDSNNNQVHSLESGNTYHFNDIFDEEIDVNSVSITNGTVKVSGNTGEQTVTFIPRLSDGDTEGGGTITATTMSGKQVSYNYNVSSPAPAPTARKLTIYAENGIFAIFREGIEPTKFDYYEDKVFDGEEITIDFGDKDDYSFIRWYDFNGDPHEGENPYTFIVDASLADPEGNIIIKAEYDKAVVPTTATLRINANGNGYITVGNDATHYQNFSRTVPVGTVITDITVVPDTDYQFIKWSDGSVQNRRDYPVYSNTTLTPVYQYVGVDDFFYVEDASGSANTLSIAKSNASADTITVYTSPDQSNWTLLGQTSTTPLTATVPAYGKLYIKANTDIWGGNRITCSDDYIVGGHIMSLLNGSSFSGTTLDGSDNISAFTHLFDGSTTLTNASNLTLPNNTVRDCYGGMFYGCTNLTGTPTLPATTAAQGCYHSMFMNCTSLTSTPVLPATTLNTFSYKDMFNGCTGLITTPALNATTLAESCYEGMFYGCTGLTSASNLPALTVSDYAYCEMFRGCTSLTTTPTISATTVGENSMYGMFMYCTGLTTATALPATTLDDDCYFYMFKGCTSLTTAPTLPATTLTLECYYEMFAECTSLVNAPVLPATTLAESCYSRMFIGCTSLTNPPILQATTLALECYYEMFAHCISLDNITTYANDISATDCLTYWLYDVANSGDFYNNGSATYTVDSESGIPLGWTERIPYTVSVSAGSNGSVSVNGVSGNYSQSVPQGTVLTLAATPNAGYQFTQWSDGNNSNPRSLTVTANTTLVATFDVIPVQTDYFYVEDASGQANTLSITKYGLNSPAIEVFKSTDQQNWESIGTTNNNTPLTATVPANSKLYLKAITNRFGVDHSNFHYLRCSGNYNMGGNIMSLLNGDNYNNATLDNQYIGQFLHLFNNSTNLINTSDLILPSNTVRYCYYMLFRNCSNLITAPTLPAATLTERCYMSMFDGCASLTTAPVLPATTLSEWCYTNMFNGCTALTQAPALPATTMADYCYGGMFNGCTSLTNPPTLPATTLAIYCYNGMFSGCTNLVYAPNLPATTLDNYCYQVMFYGCTNLVDAPQLPATTLVESCYRSMFNGCTSLKGVTTYANDISATDCLTDWLYDVANSGDFYNYGSATYTSGSSGIPSGWTEHTS